MEQKKVQRRETKGDATAECFLIKLLLTILQKIILLQKIYCYSLNKLRFIGWTRTNDQSSTDIQALQTYRPRADMQFVTNFTRI